MNSSVTFENCETLKNGLLSEVETMNAWNLALEILKEIISIVVALQEI